MGRISRRRFLTSTTVAAAGSAAFGFNLIESCRLNPGAKRHTVSIVRINGGNIRGAVEEAITLIGGIDEVTKGCDSIMLKPNLVAPDVQYTTKPEVVKAVAMLMMKAGKKVCIGEGSAAAESFNFIGNEQFITRKKDILDGMQQYVFDKLGYTELAKSLGIRIINLHSGDIVNVPVKNGYLGASLRLHREAAGSDLICSIPMMKTHVLATVTLAMKNLIGLYPGTEYYAMRSKLHDMAAEKGSPGVAYEIMDINRAVKTGLSIIDASTAMEGNGPSAGTLVDMGLIIAGTTPLATDLVGAALMGFQDGEIPLFNIAHKSGMLPGDLRDIEVRGVPVAEAARQFVRPQVVQWTDFGYKEI
jgi:uncharacterized protein (DUF362 family)